MSARDQIRNRVRLALSHAPSVPLGQSSISDTRPAPCTPAGLAEPAAARARFIEMLTAVRGDVRPVPDARAAARELQKLCAARGIQEFAVSDNPLVTEVLAELATLEDAPLPFAGWNERERLLTTPAGLTGAQFGIAETGSLLLRSRDESHRLVSLVPPHHIALLRASQIVPNLGAALTAAAPAGAPPSPLLTLITGPSRTADIELILVVGVHGPMELTVLLIDDIQSPEPPQPL